MFDVSVCPAVGWLKFLSSNEVYIQASPTQVYKLDCIVNIFIILQFSIQKCKLNLCQGINNHFTFANLSLNLNGESS